MRNHKIFFTLAALTTTLFTFQSCQKSSLADLQSAQLCLNTATQSTAQDCVTKIASDTSAYADSLRCSAIFISQGFSTPAQFIDALNTINNSGSACGGTCSPTLNALQTFNFGTQTSLAANAFNVCTKSKVKFYAQISSLFNIGTLAKAANPAASSADDIKNAIVSGSVSTETLGQIVTSTYSSVCTNTADASEETKKYCAELELAMTKSTTADIGQCLKDRLANPNLTTCP